MDVFVDCLEEEGVTVLNLPTAFWLELLAHLAHRPLPPRVRCVIVGGEEIPYHAFNTWRRRVPPSVTFINGYGPTECTVTATMHRATAADEAGDAPSHR